MKPLQSALKTLHISFDGIKEAVMAVAERVARRVQVAKLQIQAEDVEARLRQGYEALGANLYAAHAVRSLDALKMEDILLLCEQIRAEHRTLQSIRDRLASRYDDVLVVPLMRLQEDLQEGGGTVERVTITPAAQADGKPINAIPIPEDVRLAAVRRGETLLFPSDQLVLRAGDQVTVVGKRSAVPLALQALRA